MGWLVVILLLLWEPLYRFLGSGYTKWIVIVAIILFARPSPRYIVYRMKNPF